MFQSVIRQFGRPEGLLGQLVGWSMALKNKARRRWAVEQVNARPGDRILEIGFGPGLAIKAMARALETGFVAGVDHSEVMFRQASRRNRAAVQQGLVRLQHGTVDMLEYPPETFDKVLASNVHFFWKEPAGEFKKCFDLLKPDGQLILVFQPYWAKTEELLKMTAKHTKKQLKNAGFRQVGIDYKAMWPVTCITVKAVR